MKTWKKFDTDRLLNLFCKGWETDTIADRMEWPAATIKEQLERFYYNEGGRCYAYLPGPKRKCRYGFRMSNNDLKMIHAMNGKGVNGFNQCKVLGRLEPGTSPLP